MGLFLTVSHVFCVFSRFIAYFAYFLTFYRHKYWRICYLVVCSHDILVKGAVFDGFQTFSRISQFILIAQSTNIDAFAVWGRVPIMFWLKELFLTVSKLFPEFPLFSFTYFNPL